MNYEKLIENNTENREFIEKIKYKNNYKSEKILIKLYISS